MNRAEVLDLIAEMKAESLTPRARQRYDQMAIHLITQDTEPLVMAENLAHWLALSKQVLRRPQ
jgi:hypothetical protein